MQISCRARPARVRTEVPATKTDHKTRVCARLDSLGNAVKQVHMHVQMHKNQRPPDDVWRCGIRATVWCLRRGGRMPAQPMSERSHLCGWTRFLQLRLYAELHRRAVRARSAERNDSLTKKDVQPRSRGQPLMHGCVCSSPGCVMCVLA